MRRGPTALPGLASLAGLAALLLIALAPPAGAQEAPRIDASMAAPAPVKPGETGQGAMAVQYCYRNSGTVAGRVEVAVDRAPGWLVATPEPSQFQADASGGGSCGQRNVTVRLAMGRDAPAFEPGFLRLVLTGRGAASATTTDTVEVPVQADYAAEVKATPRARVRLEQGDVGTLHLQVSVGANAGTKLEITGFDPRGVLTMEGVTPGTSAGRGLDQPDGLTVPIRLTASPVAKAGVHSLTVNVTALNAQRPDIAGARVVVQAEAEVAEAKRTPGPAEGLALAGLAGAALAASRARPPASRP